MSAPPTTASKTEWRAWANATRSSLPDASNAVCAVLEAFLVGSNARVLTVEGEHRVRPYATVLSYKAFGHEVDLEPLPVLLPEFEWLTTRVNGRYTLSLHAFSSATVRHRWGILEPPKDEPSVPPSSVDVVLVPGLVFDVRGGRLGYGQGFYDRLLPQLRSNIPIIGVTRDALVVPELPLEDFDVRMTHLATESGVRPVG